MIATKYLNIENIFNKKFSANYALIILNTKIRFKLNEFKTLWNNAKIRILADGGANRALDYAREHTINLPKLNELDTMIGDFDSVRTECFEYFRMRKIHKLCQDSTDFEKSLNYTIELRNENRLKIDEIVVVQESTGRLDQIIGNLHTYRSFSKRFEDIDFHLIESNTYSYFLNADIDYYFHFDNEHFPITDRAWCSLIPFEKSVVVSTAGLKWNLQSDRLKFGEFISVSNRIVKSPIRIRTNASLLFSFGVE